MRLMPKINKLAIFDIDGTLRINGTIPESVISGLEHIQQNGYITTVSTGRGYIRAKEVLGGNFDAVISPNALLILEHGTKITDRNGKIVFTQYLLDNEIEHIVDFTKANIEIVKLLWFNPPDPTQKVQVWVYDQKYLKEETDKRDHYADVFSCSFEELKTKLLAQPLSNVTTKLKEYIKVNNLKLHFTRSAINTLFQDGNMEFVSNKANKSKAIHFIENNFKITTEKLLIAGNAINDIEMLNLAAGQRILVGNKETLSTVLGYLIKPNETVTVENPEELGLYLQKMV